MIRWLVELPGMRPLTANQRLHWAVRAERVRMWRHAAHMAIRADRVPPSPHVTVRLVVSPPDRRRRDPSNLMPTQKAAIDGMVDALVVLDDSPEFVTELIPQLLDPTPRRWRLWLEIDSTPTLRRSA